MKSWIHQKVDSDEFLHSHDIDLGDINHVIFVLKLVSDTGKMNLSGDYFFTLYTNKNTT